MKNSNVGSKAQELPKDVKAGDLKYNYEAGRPDGLDYDERELLFYQVQGRRCKQWVICTLLISKAGGRRAPGTPDRYYAIGVDDSKVYTVGIGGHVKDSVKVYVTKENQERLMKYVELRRKGMVDSQAIRDRISTRRAQGQLYRAQGRMSWMW